MAFFTIFQKKRTKQPSGLYIQQSPIHGRGVFTKRNIKPGEWIEKAPIILINDADYRLLRETVIHDYYFLISHPKNPVAVGFGFSALYNHAAPSNALYIIDLSNEWMLIKAVRRIREGEEITINYNGHPDNHSPVLFTNSPAQ